MWIIKISMGEFGNTCAMRQRKCTGILTDSLKRTHNLLEGVYMLGVEPKASGSHTPKLRVRAEHPSGCV